MSIVQLIKNYKKFGIIACIIIAILLLFLTFVVSPIAKPIAEKKLSEALKRSVTIRSIALNPFTLAIKISGFDIKEPGSSDVFVSFGKLYINLQSISIVKKGLVLKAIQLDSLYLHVVRQDDWTYNFSDLMNQPQKKDTVQKPFNFSLNNIIISNGSISFIDKPVNASHNVNDIQISVPFFSNFNYYTGIYCTPSFSARVNGTLFELKGKTKPFDKSMETVIDCNVDKINLAKYVAYIPELFNFKPECALFSANGRFSYKIENRKPFFDYSGGLSLDSIDIRTKNDSSLFSAVSIGVNVQSAELVSSSIKISSITVTKPVVHLSRAKNGTLSLATLFPSNTKQSKSTEIKDSTLSNGLSLLLKKFDLYSGEVIFRDSAVTKPAEQHIDSLSIEVSDFKLNDKLNYAIKMRNNVYQHIESSGELFFAPMTVNGICKLDSIAPATYSAYFPKELDIDVKKGILDLRTEFTFSQNDSIPQFSLQNGRIHFGNWSLSQKSTREQLLTLKQLDLVNFAFDQPGNRLTLDSVLSDQLTVYVKRTGAATLNISQLMTQTVSDTTIKKVNKPAASKSTSPEFTYKVNSIELKNYHVLFQDMTTDEMDSIILGRINVSVTGLTGDRDKSAALKFATTVNNKGSISLTGKLGLNPLKIDSRLVISNIGLKPLQAYLSNYLNIALTDGSLNMDGVVGYSMADSLPNVTYNGNIAINNLSTINKENADKFLLWKALTFNNLSFSQNPPVIHIDEIAISELYSLFNIYTNGTTNLQAILKSDSAVVKDTLSRPQSVPDTTQKVATDAPVISIDSVTLDNCNINFSDFRFRNVFSANMKNLTGKIIGLSSSQDKNADVSINGNYDATSPITISGRINPLTKNLYMDLGLKFKDIDITQMNPYSQKYLGYVIHKGKLSLDLRYFLENNKLNSTNSIFLNQLTLGEEVKSPDATSLPVKFALALLKDQNGDINLDVPVTGSLDDPKFSIGKILLQVLGNIIKKAVASPFAALSGLFGGSDELRYAEFESGYSLLTDTLKVKLDKIVNGLSQRKDLIVEIQGFADPEKDREKLRKQFFMRKLQTIKLKDLLRKTDGNILVDTITILTEEYPKYLAKAYNKEQFDKPRKLTALPNSGITGAMEKLMYENITVSDNDLKLLASSRALSVKEYFTVTGHIDISRIFMIESRSIAPEFKENVKNSRVEFTLKLK